VLHLWTFEADAPGFPEELQRRGAFGVLLLLQALAQTGEGRGLRLQVVSSRSQAMRPGEPLDCEKALLLGLLQTAPQELPWLDARHLDLEPGAAPEENATRVLRELTVGPREREVAYREGRRLVPRLERVELTAAAQRPLPLVTGGMYLVTGGLGALGAELARRLLSHHRARLLLLGRTELSGTGGVERRRTLEELAAFATRVGGEVRYAALDVCDLEGLREGVRRAEADWGRTLDGAFHLAGAIEERLLSDESPEHFAEVLRPKVEGTRALARLLDERPGAFLIGFSSVNATFGGFSAGAYSAANRFLEHFLQARREAGASRDVCLAWSRWDGLGPARSETAARLASARGYQPIPPSRGWTSLLVGLCSTEGQLLIGLDEHNPYLRAQVEGMAPRARQLTAFLTPERVHARPPSQLRDSLGTPVACELRQVDRLPRTAGGVVDMDALLAVDAGGAGAERAREAPSGEVEARVAAVWREYLGVEEVGMLDNFFELGGHSMLIAQVHSRLERDFGRRFPVLELFRYPTVRALAGYLSAVEQPDGGGDEIEERARRQRAVRGRRRSRQVLHSGGGIDE
jgi:NAD(P)-dependent dehydrogenase (short-subunit alcohol dehydrogenase family)/acyl carrier protein